MLLNSLNALNAIKFGGNAHKHTDTKLSIRSLYFEPELYRRDSKQQASGVPGGHLKVLA
jgi:hypothetical protein